MKWENIVWLKWEKSCLFEMGKINCFAEGYELCFTILVFRVRTSLFLNTIGEHYIKTCVKVFVSRRAGTLVN